MTMSRAPPGTTARAHTILLMPSPPLGITPLRDGSKLMSKRLRTFAVHVIPWVLALGRHGADAVRRGWEALRYRYARVPMEILVADRARRRKIERELRTGLHQLQRILGERPLGDIAVVVQQVITTDRHLAGCCQIGKRPDGTPCALWRLALQVNGRPLSSDELLAVLAEQWIVLASQGSNVLVPVDFEPREANPTRRSPALRPDPLMPYPDGANPHRP